MSTAAETPPVGSIPDHDELIRRARALREVLRERGDEVEKARQIPQETIDELTAAGFFRLSTLRSNGGYQVPGRTRSEILSILAAGDASTAWVVGVYSGGGTSAQKRSGRVKEELFANGPDLKICGSGTPARDVQQVDGGYVVSGRFFSVSGSTHADWASVFLALPPGPDGKPGLGQALIPLPDLKIEKTWDAAGMRGTESETVVADKLFVPDYRVELVAGPPPADPAMSVGPCAVPLGIAQGALDRAVELARAKPLAGTIYSPARESPSYQIELADAAMHIDSARLHLFRATEDIDRAAASGEPMDVMLRARCRGDAGWIMKNITEAIDKIMTAVGSGAFSESSPFERAWRDVSTLARHGAVNYMINREVYGKVLLGLDGNISRLPV